MEEYEVNLADYLRVLWRGKWLVIIITVVALAASIIFSLGIPSIYQARTQLMIMPTIAAEVVPAERPLAPETYRRLATARDLLREVGDTVYGPGEITVEALVDRMQVTIDGVEVFPLLTMTVTGSDPRMVTDLANTWARLFMERNSAFLMSRIARSYEFVATSFAEIQTDLSAKEVERKVFKQANPRALLATKLERLLATHRQNMIVLEEKRHQFKMEEAEVFAAEIALIQHAYNIATTLLEEKRNSLAAEKARIAQIEREWEEIAPVVVLRQGLDLRDIGVFLAGGLTEAELAGLPALVVEQEVKNALFFSFEHQIKEGRTTIARMQKEIVLLANALAEYRVRLFQEDGASTVPLLRRERWFTAGPRDALFYSLERQTREGRVTIAALQTAINRLEETEPIMTAQIAELSAQLAKVDLTIAMLDRDIATLQEMHHGLAQSLLNARIARAEEPEPITVVEAAIVPQVPIGPRRMLNVAIAGILGLMIGVFVAFAAHYLKDNQSRVSGLNI
ncbi:hypothetical protein LM599_04285 [Candidatus Acetothermia bacterium]|jgi:capsular polysaccharide biosynthesis protein|nr:hypothetical protein [Candidatus Acetothermia bacterium]MCI2427298.1 hypothetical protein [Candidatus Acetothermia bacterium]MCI2428076.1 hypothetical protein [Candidatus Acetothermia bacterium]